VPEERSHLKLERPAIANARDIAAGAVQIPYQADADWVCDTRKNDRNRTSFRSDG